MNDDYITGLRKDLVAAAARQHEAGRATRVARPLRPRAWSPVALLGAAATVAALLVVVVALRTVAPPPQPTARIVATIPLGGQPLDAVAVGGSLVFVDYEGAATMLDAEDPDVRTLLDSEGTPVSLAADGNVLWVLSAVPSVGRAPRFQLVKIEVQRRGEGFVLLSRRPVDRFVDAVAAGAAGLWLPPTVLHRGDLGPIGLDGGGRALTIPGLAVEGLVVGERAAWVRVGDAVIELDARGRSVNRVDGLSPVLAFQTQHTLVPDADGAWVVGQAGGLLYRIEGGRVARRVKVGRTAGVVARTRSAVWVSATSDAHRYELVRVDPDDGRVTGRVPLGLNAPQAIVPLGKQLWVITSGGDAIVVNPE